MGFLHADLFLNLFQALTPPWRRVILRKRDAQLAQFGDEAVLEFWILGSAGCAA
jgi:hypothetical protein